MNVQQTIINGIKEQLFLNNYLVLPNFGGFVLKLRAAHFSTSGGLLMPPSKTVSFNVQLKQNDSILAVWLQNVMNISADESLRHLHDFAEFCSGVLNAKRRLSLDGIGFFYLDFENNICFEPQQDSNFLSSSFGLAPLAIKELDQESQPLKKETVFVDRTIAQTESIQKIAPVKRSYRRIVSPLILFVLFFGLLAFVVSNSKISGELRSSLFGTESKNNYSPISYSDLNISALPHKSSTYIADANGIAALELEKGVKFWVKAVETGITTTDLSSTESLHAVSSNKKNKFEIVLGCFTQLNNAKRMVKKVSKYEIRVKLSGKNAKGMYVVSNGSFDTKEEALSQLQQIQDNFPNAWIKKGEK